MIRSVFRIAKIFKPQPKYILPQYSYKFTAVPTYRFSAQAPKEIDQKLVDEVETKVFHVLKSAAKCKVDKLSRSATLEELGFDSLDIVEMVVAMEENFGIDLQDEEADKIHTVQDLVQAFYKHKKEAQNKAETKQ